VVVQILLEYVGLSVLLLKTVVSVPRAEQVAAVCALQEHHCSVALLTNHTVLQDHLTITAVLSVIILTVFGLLVLTAVTQTVVVISVVQYSLVAYHSVLAVFNITQHLRQDFIVADLIT
jgi:hypothetical protein